MECSICGKEGATMGFECNYCGEKNANYYWVHSWADLVACNKCVTYTKRSGG